MLIKSFDVHGLVRVRVESCLQAKVHQVMHHLAEFEERADHGHMPHVMIQDYSRAPALAGATMAADHYFYADGTLNIPAYKLCYNLAEVPIKVYCNRLLLPVSLLIQLALLPNGFSLIHAAAVGFKGRHYLFPALGGG